MARAFSKLLNYFPWYQRLSKSPQLSAWACLLYLTPPPSHSLLLIPCLTSLPKMSSYPVKQSSLWSGQLTNESILSTLQSSQASNSSILRVRETGSPSLPVIPRYQEPPQLNSVPTINLERSWKSHRNKGALTKHTAYSFRITFATFVIKLVCPLLTLLESWHHVLLKIYLILGDMNFKNCPTENNYHQ